MIVRLLAQISADEINVPKGTLPETTIDTVLQTVFLVFGGVAVIVVTVAGLYYVLSQGNPQATARAKNTILYALVGLAVSIFAYTIVRFVVSNV